ncbi:MAG: sulfotransferase [Gemmatimonadota bacterium]
MGRSPRDHADSAAARRPERSPDAVARRPDFLFIGPDKTGSTWLYEVLRRHLRCYVPEVKDLYYFDRYYDRGPDWYLSHFAAAPADARAVGELSHDYLFSPAAARRIARDLPGVRLLTCLRDPVERTFSHYLYLVRSGLVREPFEEALRRRPELIEHSLYARHLRPYLARFPRGRIKILWFERLRDDPEAFAREACDFLGLDVREALPLPSRVLPAARPRVHALARLAKWGANACRDLGFARAVGLVKRSPLAQRALYVPYRGAARPSPAAAWRDRLRERFREDVEDLGRLLDIDLRHWLTETGGSA